MVDIPSTPAPTPITPPVAVPTVTPVEGSVASLPDKIQQLLRQIQVSGTITKVDGNEITLNSVIGKLTILLPQLVEIKQQQLTQQLIALLDTQKPITVVVQPGNPPTQAIVLLPPASPPTQQAPLPTAVPKIIENNILLQTLNQPKPQPLIIGSTVPAVVLPPNIVIPNSPATPQQPPQNLPSSNIPASTTPPPVITSPPTQAILPTPLNTLPPLPQNLPTQIASINLTPELLTTLITQEVVTKVGTKVKQAIDQAQQQIIETKTAPLTSNNKVTTTSPTPTLTPAIGTNPAPLATVSDKLPPSLMLLFQPGNEVNLRIEAISLPTNTPQQPPFVATQTSAIPQQATANAPNTQSQPINTLNLLASGPNQVVATVIGQGPNNEIILKAGDATLYVKQRIDVAIGTSVLISAEPAQPQNATALPQPLSQTISTMQQLLTTLVQIDPQMARAVIENHIPQPTAALPGALLFLMSAFKQGSNNVRGWLGDAATDALTRAGKFELLSKVTQNLNNVAQSVQDPVVGEWKSYPIPLHNQGQFQILNLYVHNQGQQQSGKENVPSKGNSHTRFLIDMRLSQLGSMQLDGFIQAKKLDMIVRSEKTLPDGLHTELRQIYAKTLIGIDYAGSLNFQVGRHNWLNIQQDQKSAAITT
ncbi:MAG: hypothetical protein WAO98_08730 [Alphaproteobacteria bacterium]